MFRIFLYVLNSIWIWVAIVIIIWATSNQAQTTITTTPSDDYLLLGGSLFLILTLICNIVFIYINRPIDKEKEEMKKELDILRNKTL